MQRLAKSIDVDHIICGANDPEAAFRLYEESKSVLKEGGFNLRTFVTNVPNLQQKIDEKEEVPQTPNDSWVPMTPSRLMRRKPSGQDNPYHPVSRRCWEYDGTRPRIGCVTTLGKLPTSQRSWSRLSEMSSV